MIKAYILTNTIASREDSIVDIIKSFEGVTEVEAVYGKYDYIVSVEVKDQKMLNSIVSDKIRATPGVTATHTLITSRKFKDAQNYKRTTNS